MALALALKSKLKNLYDLHVGGSASAKVVVDGELNVYRNAFLITPDNPFDATELFNDRPGKGLAGCLNGNRLIMTEKKGIVHAHVVVEMPSQAVQNDQLRGKGELAQRLAAALTEKHMKAFGQDMDGVQARYVVRKDASLQAGQIRLSFGQAVYVPEAAERKAWLLEWSMDGAIWNPVADLYEKQPLVVVGGKRAFDKFAQWPFGSDFSVVFEHDIEKGTVKPMSEPADSLNVEEDADGYYKISAVDGDAFFCLKATPLLTPVKVKPMASAAAAPVAPAPAPAAAAIVVPVSASAAAPDGRKEPVLLQVAPPVAVGEPLVDTIVGAGPREPVASDYKTCVPRPGGKAASGRVGMSLAGIALQKVSDFGADGIIGLQFAVDAVGNVVAPGSGGAKLTFAVSSDDALSMETAAGATAIAIGQSLRVSNTLKVQLAPSPAPEYLLGIYKLPTPVFEALGHGAGFTFGRGEISVLKSLRKLSGLGFLHAVKDGGGDIMGLSKSHFTLEVKEQGLVVVPQVGNGRLLHLDENMAFVETMDMGAQESWTVPAGHHLVAGHYVLRYDA